MTNFENISSSTEEMSKFICKVAYGRFDPWVELFSQEFCHTCPTTHVIYSRIEDMNGNVICDFEKDTKSREDDLHPCDYTDGECPHGDDVSWWLSQEYVYLS